MKTSLIYKATVKKTGKYYIGVSENNFKSRYARHTYSFRTEEDKGATSLSKHVWDIGENPNPEIKWEITKQLKPRKPGDRECALCI